MCQTCDLRPAQDVYGRLVMARWRTPSKLPLRPARGRIPMAAFARLGHPQKCGQSTRFPAAGRPRWQRNRLGRETLSHVKDTNVTNDGYSRVRSLHLPTQNQAQINRSHLGRSVFGAGPAGGNRTYFWDTDKHGLMKLRTGGVLMTTNAGKTRLKAERRGSFCTLGIKGANTLSLNLS